MKTAMLPPSSLWSKKTCLVDDTLRGSRFEVANLEVWTLTPHLTINEAQRSEFASLFLEGAREEKDLNLIGILTGGTI